MPCLFGRKTRTTRKVIKMSSKGNYWKTHGGLTNEEIQKRHRREDGDAYMFDVEYEKLKKEREEAEREYEKARDEYVRITKELREEMINGTASQSDMSRFMSALTDRGVQLQQQQAQMQKQIDQLAESRADVENQMNDLRMRAFGGNTRAWKSADKDYKGFKVDATDKRYANAKLVEMTPEEYLRRVAFDVKGSGMKDVMQNASPSTVEKYMRQMLRGTRFNAPTLNYRNGNTTGNERAIAALLNGYSRIPVMVVEKG